MWQYWKTSELQEEIGEDNLNFFEYLIPRLQKETNFSSFIGNKNKLALIVESLQDHNYFRRVKNLEKCLYRTPADIRKKLVRNLGLDETYLDHLKLSKYIQSNEDRFGNFIKFFDLDKRFISERGETLAPYFDNFCASAENPKVIQKPHKS